MTVSLYIPGDSAACSVGAQDVAHAIAHEAARRGANVKVIRNGSRGLYWLEPLIEVETAQGGGRRRVAVRRRAASGWRSPLVTRAR